MNILCKWRVLPALLLAVLTAGVAGACALDDSRAGQDDPAYKTLLSKEGSLDIVREPPPLDFRRGVLADLPTYNGKDANPFQVDLRSYDLTSLDLTGRLEDLLHSDFDSKTNWPAKLPSGFAPEKLMELGKNPGLNVRELHKRGIDGRGVGLAMIDQGLLVSHIEYRDRLKMYEELHCIDETASMHGPAVASIAVGKNVGVAPGADLYYIAETHADTFDLDFTWTAKAIDRLLQVNEALPEGKKIRAISVSAGWTPERKGYKEVNNSVERAKKAGVFVISTVLQENYRLGFHGLGRRPFDDPDSRASYGPGIWWREAFFNGEYSEPGTELLMVPMDSRCTAGPTGDSDYMFSAIGGWSWSVPYIAGLYALACQAEPDITPERFWAAALETGDTNSIEKDGGKYVLGKIANPVRLIESLQK